MKVKICQQVRWTALILEMQCMQIFRVFVLNLHWTANRRQFVRLLGFNAHSVRVPTQIQCSVWILKFGSSSGFSNSVLWLGSHSTFSSLTRFLLKFQFLVLNSFHFDWRTLFAINPLNHRTLRTDRTHRIQLWTRQAIESNQSIERKEPIEPIQLRWSRQPFTIDIHHRHSPLVSHQAPTTRHLPVRPSVTFTTRPPPTATHHDLELLGFRLHPLDAIRFPERLSDCAGLLLHDRQCAKWQHADYRQQQWLFEQSVHRRTAEELQQQLPADGSD